MTEETTEEYLERVVGPGAYERMSKRTVHNPSPIGPSPSKNCLEGGEHCPCVDIEEPQHIHCCWCNFSERFGAYKPVPGHGPYRTELVRD